MDLGCLASSPAAQGIQMHCHGGRCRVEGRDEWRAELTRRKGAKTQNGRIEETFELLGKLELPPAMNSAGLVARV